MLDSRITDVMCISDIKEAGRLFSASLCLKSSSTVTNLKFMIQMLEHTEKVMTENENLSTTVANQLRLTRNLLKKVRSLLTKKNK